MAQSQWTRQVMLLLLVAPIVAACGADSTNDGPEPAPDPEVTTLPDPDTPPADGVLRPALEETLEFEASFFQASFEIQDIEVTEVGVFAGGPSGLYRLDEASFVLHDDQAVRALGNLAGELVVHREEDVYILGSTGERPLLAGVPHALPQALGGTGEEAWVATAERLWMVRADATGSAELRQIAAPGAIIGIHGAAPAEQIVVEDADGLFTSLTVTDLGTQRHELNTDATFDFAFPTRAGRIVAAMEGELVERREYDGEAMWLWLSLGEDAPARTTHGAVDPITGATWVTGDDKLFRVVDDTVSWASVPSEVGRIQRLIVTSDSRVWIVGTGGLVVLRTDDGPRPQTSELVTFGDIERAASASCASCHVDGQAGDRVPLTNYEQWVVSTDAAIAAIESETMPPEPATPAPHLAELLIQWRDGGFATEEQP